VTTARRLGGFLLHHLITVATFAGLGAVAFWGVATGWRLESPFAAAAGDDPPGESAPAIRVAAGPEPSAEGVPAVVRAQITFPAAEDVRRAGFRFAAAEAKPQTRYVTAAASIGYDPGLYFQITSRTPGTVWWVEKVPGLPVAKGEVLALLDVAEVGKLKADLLADLTQYEFQTRTLERLREAAQATNNVSGRSVEEARLAVENARFKLLGDQQALLNLGLAIDPEVLRNVPAADRIARIRFMGLPESALARVREETASANLLPVVSPLDGFVITRPVTRGEAVAVHKPLFVVAGLDQVHIELAVDPRDADLLRVGQTVLFTPDKDGAVEARGKLAHLVPEVDEVTRKVWAHAEAANPDGRLRPNAFGRGRIVVGEDRDAVVVPDEAVQRDGADALVFVRTDETTFEARRVTTGLKGDGVTAVDRVKPGETVVTTGSHALLAELRRDQLGGGD
jgi:cobalt-zinc-cadmium efflux system membrane fusion protein